MIRKLTLYLSFLIILFAGGCSSDEPLLLPPGADGEASLNLLIPSAELARATGLTRGAEIATRAHASTAELKAAEGTMKEIHIVGFRTDAGKRTHFHTQVTPEMGRDVDGIYRSFAFDVETGSYNLYLLVNLDPESIANLDNTGLSEEAEKDLEENVKGFAADYSTALPDLADGLPMATSKTGVAVSKGNKTNVKVDLGFLCAKVRLTVIREEEVGATGATVSALKAVNVYSPVTAFSTVGSANKYNIDSPAALGGHYALGDVAGKSVEELGTLPENGLDDPLDKLGDPIADLASSLANAYQSVTYLPESPEISSANPATALLASIITSSGYKEVSFPLGCKNNSTDHDSNAVENGGRLERGHFYDIVAKIKGGDIEFSWRVADWDVTNLSVELAGNTQLYLGATEISETVSGETPQYLSYSTSAPFLSFESSEITVAGKSVPLFELTENKETGLIEVSISSQVSPGTTVPAEGKGFWVVAGSIRKFVEVPNVDLSEFVRISPEERHLYISQIVNATQYSLWYQYSTNMEGLSIKLSDYANSNTKKGVENLKIRIYTGTVSEPEAWSKEVALSDGMTISAIEKNSADMGDFPKSGLICITLVDPAEQAAFGSEISGKITAAAGTKSDAGTFNVYPQADKYVIWFKSINPDWDNPHIYVYQALTYYNADDRKEYYVFDKNGSINWLEYSFTGKLVFKGWQKEFGSVAAPTNLQDVTQGGATFKAYKEWNDDASNGDHFSDDQYFKDLDLIADYRSKVTSADAAHMKCNECRGGATHSLWPGIAMIKDDATGWYYAELPMLAEPGKALIMFTNGHNKDGDYSGGKRYPESGEPGIPLPNFASGQAWFLHDKDHKSQLAFSDYPRSAYPAAPVHAADYVIHGSIIPGTSDWNDSQSMTLEGSKYVLRGVTCKDGSFGIKERNADGSQKTWFNSANLSFMDGSHEDIGGLDLDKDGDNWKLSPGCYNFIFDPSSKTLKVEFADENILIAWPKDWNSKDLYNLYMWDNDNKEVLGGWPGTGQQWYDNDRYYIWVASSGFVRPLFGHYKFKASGNNQECKDTDFDSSKVEYIESTDALPDGVKNGAKTTGYYKINYANW